MSPSMTINLEELMSFPRVSGDEPYLPASGAVTKAFSPRERG